MKKKEKRYPKVILSDGRQEREAEVAEAKEILTRFLKIKLTPGQFEGVVSRTRTLVMPRAGTPSAFLRMLHPDGRTLLALAVLASHFRLPPAALENQLQRLVLHRKGRRAPMCSAPRKSRTAPLGGCNFLYLSSGRERRGHMRAQDVPYCLALQAETGEQARCVKRPRERGEACEHYIRYTQKLFERVSFP